MSEHPVTIRPANHDDIRFVMDSWLSSHRYSYHTRGIEGPVYYLEQRKVCEVLLQRAACFIASDTVDTSSIFGYLVCEIIDNALVVHWLYVRGGFQDHGLGTKLLRFVLDQEPDLAAIVYTHQTKAGRKWATKMAKRAPENSAGVQLPVVYNPYFMYQTLGEW